MVGNALNVLLPTTLGLVFLEIFLPHHSVINTCNNSCSLFRAYLYYLPKENYLQNKDIGTLTSLHYQEVVAYRGEVR